jgi:ribosomal protein L16 Arg81 hydroxylase
MQNSFVRLAEFSRALASFFRGKIDVHGFLTPQNAQGLSAHYDASSAFLIQLRGAKRWRLYEMQIEAPAPDQTFDARNPIKGEPIDEITLTPGDVLYLPKGLPHEGVTFEMESLHLTVVLFPRSWIDILSLIQKECQKDEDFRKAPFALSPDGFDDSKNQKEAWSELCEKFVASATQGMWSENSEAPPVVSPLSRRGRWI